MQEERISKIIARSGFCSRRAAEELISDKRVKLNNKLVETLGTKANREDTISIDNKPIKSIDQTRLWLYHKPKGIITSHKDEKGRKTVFDQLPKKLPRVISIGRLDYNSEGLLLLTNDGEFARFMELPKREFIRKYKVRVFGDINRLDHKQLNSGIVIDNMKYKPIDIELDRTQGSNSWFIISLSEGKNREIRKIFEYYGLVVNRLIRIAYSIFELGDLAIGQTKEIDGNIIEDFKYNYENNSRKI